VLGSIGVWIDECCARVVVLWPDQEPSIITIHGPEQQEQVADFGAGSNGSADRQAFYREVVDTVRPAGALVLLGGGQSLRDLYQMVDREPALRGRLIGVETMGSMPNVQLVERVREAFRRRSGPAVQRPAI
jgi:hypothetical protein